MILNLIKSDEQMQQEMQAASQQSAQLSLVDQTCQLAGTPLMDPHKNPQLAEQACAAVSQLAQQPPEQ